MTEWQEVTLGDLVRRAGGRIRTGPFGSQLHRSDYTDDPSGVPVVMPKDMRDGRVDTESISRVDETIAAKLAVHRLVSGDLVLARRGDVGRYAFIEPDEEGWLCGTGSMRIHAPDHSVLEPRFLRYAMSHPLVTDWFVGQAVGATMPNLNAAIVEELPLQVPGVATQRRVATALAALDELIETNERRIEVLEDLAQSLYREWFVHFRFPGHENADLVDSELGPIPTEWEVRRIAELTEVLSRGISPKYADDGSSIVLNQKCIRGGQVSLGPARRQERVVPEGKRVRRGDVLINSTGVGTLGRVAMYLGNHESLTADSHVTIARVSDSAIEGWFGMQARALQPSFEALGTGSTGQTELSRQAIGEIGVLRATPDIHARFESLIWPLLSAVPVLVEQNNTFVATRDLLLPRLVTGKLDISEVDLGDLLPSEAA